MGNIVKGKRAKWEQVFTNERWAMRRVYILQLGWGDKPDTSGRPMNFWKDPGPFPEVHADTRVWPSSGPGSRPGLRSLFPGDTWVVEGLAPTV